MAEGDINIYGAFRAQTGEGKAAYAAQVYDEAKGKFQSQINQEMAEERGVYDISASHSGTKYADLAAALGTNGANVPEGIRRGGMSVKFVHTSDNKYVQYRLTKPTWSVEVNNWQDEDSLIADGGLNTKAELSLVDDEDNCIVQLKQGHIKTKEFDSRESATKQYAESKAAEAATAAEVELQAKVAEVDNGENDDESLSIVDEESNCIVQLKQGHIKTKEFDSRNAALKGEVAGVDNVELSDSSLSFVDEEDNCIAQFKGGDVKTKNFNSANFSVSEICIPDEITAVVGDNLQIFFKSIIATPNYERYGVVVNCAIGKSYYRYFEVKPVAGDVGTHALTIIVFDNNGKIVNSKRINLKVVAQATSQSPAKNILAIASSTFAYGVVIPEVNRRFSNTSGDGTPANPTGLGLTGINFIGRKEVDGIHQEATGGYSWKTYATNALKTYRFYVSGVSAITLDATYTIDGVPIPSGVGYLRVIEVNITEGTGNILCEVNGGAVYPDGSIPASGTLIKRSGTGDASIVYSSTVEEDGNPFWNTNTGKLDFANYSQQYCNGASIDIIYTHLGNGFTSKLSVDAAIENYAKPFIRQYHTDYPNGKFVIGTFHLGSPNGGYASIGYASSVQNWYNISDVYWYALKKYQEILQDSEFSSYVSIDDCTAEFDCENGYPTTNKAVNNRISVTEAVQTNQIHPTDDGKKMISDTIYRSLTKIFNL